MNRGEIRDEIRLIVQDSGTNSRWTDAELNTRIDQAHERVAALTLCIRDTMTDDIVSGTAEYTLDTSILALDELSAKTGSDDWYEVIKVTEQELNTLSPNWRNESGSRVLRYFQKQTEIVVYPKPDFSSTGGLSMNVRVRPTAFSADASIPYNSDPELYPFHDALVFDVAQKCKLDTMKYDEAGALGGLFLQRIDEIKRQIMNKEEDTKMPNIYDVEMSKPAKVC